MAAFYIRRHNELYHHGIKGQKWGIRRYQNEDGSLTPEGRKRYGVEGLDSSKKDYDQRTAVKAYRKESKQRYNQVRNFTDDLSRYKLAEDRMNRDIIEANKNKQFVADWKKAAKRFYNAYNNDTEDWLDAEEASIKELKRKYPQFKELISGFAPHEHIYSKEHLDEVMKLKPSTKLNRSKYGDEMDDNPISTLLNNDFYYENTEKDKNDAFNLSKKATEELDKYFMDKYGSEVVTKGNKQNKAFGAAAAVGAMMVPVLLAGGVGALIAVDLKNK